MASVFQLLLFLAFCGFVGLFIVAAATLICRFFGRRDDEYPEPRDCCCVLNLSLVLLLVISAVGIGIFRSEMLSVALDKWHYGLITAAIFAFIFYDVAARPDDLLKK